MTTSTLRDHQLSPPAEAHPTTVAVDADFEAKTAELRRQESEHRDEKRRLEQQGKPSAFD